MITALAPSQTVADGVEIETVASALTMTVAVFEIGSKQSGLGSVMIALYVVVPIDVVGAEYVIAVAPAILIQVPLLDCH